MLFDGLQATMSYVIRVILFHDVAGLGIFKSKAKPTLQAPTPPPDEYHQKPPKLQTGYPEKFFASLAREI